MDNGSDMVSTILSALHRLTIELNHIHNRRDQEKLIAARVEAIQVVQAVAIEAPRDIKIVAEHQINIGNIVRIMNNHKKLKETCGRLVKKTWCRGTMVTVSGAEYVQSLSNLEVV